MITPGTAPEGAYVPGTGFGQSYQGVTPEQARAQMTAPFQDAFGSAGQVFIATIGGILNDVFQAIVAAAQAIGVVATNIWNGLVDAVTGIFNAIGDALSGIGNFRSGSTLAEAKDRQLELNERFELLEDVSGYISAYMKENHFKVRRTWHRLAFNGQLGPNKNAEMVTDGEFKDTIWLAKGTWVISTQVAHDQHADRRYSSVRVTGYSPDGAVFTTKEAHAEVLPDKKLTIPVQHTVVVPDNAGLYIEVTATYDVGDAFGIYKKLRYLGGTHLTHLTAHRLNLDTSNAVREEDIPTIGSE